MIRLSVFEMTSDVNEPVIQAMLCSVRFYVDRTLPCDCLNISLTRFSGFRREEEPSTLEIVPFFRQGMHPHSLVFYAR